MEKTGHALYAEMAPGLAAAARQQSAQFEAMMKRVGPLSSLRFAKVLPNGADDYVATFAHGQLEVIIVPLTPDGKIPGMLYRPIP